MTLHLIWINVELTHKQNKTSLFSNKRTDRSIHFFVWLHQWIRIESPRKKIVNENKMQHENKVKFQRCKMVKSNQMKLKCKWKATRLAGQILNLYIYRHRQYAMNSNSIDTGPSLNFSAFSCYKTAIFRVRIQWLSTSFFLEF